MIDEQYHTVTSQLSDIWEHLPTLYHYAKECTTIAEFGVRSVVSTWAFLKGLKENDCATKRLYCVDIDDVPRMREIIPEVKKYGTELTFIQQDSAKG